MGGGELVLIMFVALLLFGGDKLPGLAKTLGKGIRDFKDASDDVKREINNQINNYDEKKETVAEKPAELPEHKADNNDESKPLIDTSPVAGAMTFSETPLTYDSDGTPMHYDENGHLVAMMEEKTGEGRAEETEEAEPQKINLAKE
ncbi:twin-arginine translocase TatA/TatE family subunit [Mucilaginibacter myungsuensis]|uniref:Sec-independent protein translocase protein TatA n=2 Tax=Mucilaginibacter myungsuensis TaxID=649104 RepID=A0A929L2G7_9SPHI|nr:twin-arginine translocase TatA/TatE family subunit [Mucilaginibacter myungsuensis]